MAFGDACSTVGIDYIRDAAMNLALIRSVDAPIVPAQPVVTSLPVDEAPIPKLGPVEVPPRRSQDPVWFDVDNDIPTLARYGPRKNSSILKRLAGKFGFPQ